MLKSYYPKMSPGQYMGSCNSQRHWNLKLLVAFWKSEVWEQNCVWLFYYFNFERNYEVSKSKRSYIWLRKNINFNKNKTKPKMENPSRSFNCLRTSPTKWSNTLKQLVSNLPMNCLTVFDHFVILALKGLKTNLVVQLI